MRRLLVFLILVFFTLFLPNSAFAGLRYENSVWQDDKECTWDSGKCNPETEACVYQGLTRHLDCVLGPKWWEYLTPSTDAWNFGTCSYNSEHDDLCTDERPDGDRTPTCLYGPYTSINSREVNTLRDYSLCRPIGTTASFPVSSSKNICSITPEEGETGNTYFHLYLSGDALGYIVTDSNGNFVDSVPTTEIDSNGKVSSFTISKAGEYSFYVRGYDKNLEQKFDCVTKKISVKGDGQSSLGKCNYTTNNALQPNTPIPEGIDVALTISDLEPGVEYVAFTEPFVDIKSVDGGKADSQGRFQFSFVSKGNPTIRIFKKGDMSKAICDPISFGTIEQEDTIIYAKAAPPPCAKKENGRCVSVNTGLGIALGTDASSFIQSLFGVILGLSGGIALLLIIASGFKLIFSRGNPEKMQGVKESLTAAIVGLLFIIFSIVILEVIGVDILKLPGFGT